MRARQVALSMVKRDTFLGSAQRSGSVVEILETDPKIIICSKNRASPRGDTSGTR